MPENMTVESLRKRWINFVQFFCIGRKKRIHCSGSHFRMLTIMDRIKKIILIISAWMKFIKVSIQMWQDFCWKRIIPGLIPFSMEPNLHTCSVADDIFQPHIDQFFNPAPGFISMDHEVLITASIPCCCIRPGEDRFQLFRSQVFKLRICFSLEAAD